MEIVYDLIPKLTTVNRTGIFAFMVENKTIWELGTPYNKEEAIRRGYSPTLITNLKGGPLVVQDGDIAYVSYSRNREKARKLLNDAMDELTERIGGYRDGNDIMLNGKKVAGSTEAIPNLYRDGFYCGYVSIAMSVNLDDIKAICTEKPMIKEPMGLSDAGFTREDLLL